MDCNLRELKILGLELLYDCRSEEGEHDFMVAGECEPSAAPQGWSAHDIGVRTVMLDKVHIDRGEVLE